MVVFNIPEYVEYEGHQTGDIFGDIGTYQYTTNNLDTTTTDEMLCWLDLDYIDNYYRTYNILNPAATPSPDVLAIMHRAGFDMPIEYTSAEEHEYPTFLDIPYEVRTVSDPASASWQDLTGGNRTPYEQMMYQLSLRITRKDYKTVVNAGLGGDATLDGQVTQSDITYLQDIVDNASGDEYLYVFRKEYNSEHVTRNIWQNIYRTFQIIINCHLYTTVGQALAQDDVTAMTALLDDIYQVHTYPTDTAVWSNSANIAFTIILGRAPAFGQYVYKWLKNDTVLINYTDATTDAHNITTITTGPLSAVSVSDNNSVFSVSIYEHKDGDHASSTDYENSALFNKRTYSASLFVADETDVLWGDVTNNGSVNIIDAYTILNNYLYKRGDVNKDDKVNGVDASTTLTYYSKVSVGESAEQAAAELNVTTRDMDRGDVNLDGKVDAKDASLISFIYSKLSTGSTEEQVEALMTEKIGKPFTFYPDNIAPKTLGDLNALLTIDGVRSTTYNKATGELILASIKDKNIHLS